VARDTPIAIEHVQLTSRRKLTPAHSLLAIKRQQARRRALRHDLAQGASVVLPRSLEIRRAEPPIHAPAPVASAVLAEEVFQSWPQIRREWADGELHAD